MLCEKTCLFYASCTSHNEVICEKGEFLPENRQSGVRLAVFQETVHRAAFPGGL